MVVRRGFPEKRKRDRKSFSGEENLCQLATLATKDFATAPRARSPSPSRRCRWRPRRPRLQESRRSPRLVVRDGAPSARLAALRRSRRDRTVVPKTCQSRNRSRRVETLCSPQLCWRARLSSRHWRQTPLLQRSHLVSPLQPRKLRNKCSSTSPWMASSWAKSSSACTARYVFGPFPNPGTLLAHTRTRREHYLCRLSPE